MTKSPRDIAGIVLASKQQGRTLPTDLDKITGTEPLHIRFLTTRRRFDGRFEYIRGRPHIFVNDHGGSRNGGRVRFTLAHEFGHYILHRHVLHANGAFQDTRIHLGENTNQREREANEFASEILLPTDLVRGSLAGKYLTIQHVAELADQAAASISATAIQVARITSDRICFLWEEEDLISWVVPSDDWRASKLPWSSLRGNPPPPEARAAKNPGDYEEQETTLVTWCPNHAWRNGQVFEAARHTPYGRLILLIATFDSDDT